MPFVKISKDAHKDMKQFLVDIEGLTLGELLECAFEYAMQNIKDFEDFLEIEDNEQIEVAEADTEDKEDEE